MRKADHTEKKKQNRKSRKIYVTAIAVMLAIATFVGTYQATANVADNLAGSDISILGKLNDVVSGDFGTATTNAKLNRMKTDVDSVRSSVSGMIQPYVGSLTLWVDSNSGTYAGQTVTVTNAKGQSQTGRFVARNGHYEVDFPSLIKGSYSVRYPFLMCGGTKVSLTCSVNVTGTIKQQLFGDLFQMSMAEIRQACKDGEIHQFAHIGDTISDGTYTYTVIGINQDKPSDASGNLLNSSKYRDVLTVMPLGAPTGAANGSPVTFNMSATPWGTTDVEQNDLTSTLTPYFEKLPKATQNVIGYVQKCTGAYDEHFSLTALSTTGNRCFLLSSREVFGSQGSHCCSSKEYSATFQYQYFSDLATTAESRDFHHNCWLLRSIHPNRNFDHMYVYDGTTIDMGGWFRSGSFFPAFCIY